MKENAIEKSFGFSHSMMKKNVSSRLIPALKEVTSLRLSTSKMNKKNMQTSGDLQALFSVPRSWETASHGADSTEFSILKNQQ